MKRKYYLRGRCALCLTLALTLVLSPLTSSELYAKKKKNGKATVSSVKFINAGKKLRLQKGKKFQLKTTVKCKPDKKKYQKVKFTSSNKKVVLVNSRGLLKGKKIGTAKITATSKTNTKKKASIHVTVTNDVLVSSIKLNRTKITVDEFNEDEIALKVTKILPSNAENKDVNWSTSDEEVADVDDDGVVTTGNAGTAIITAAADDQGGAAATCKVTVTENTEDEKDTSDDTSEDAPAALELSSPVPANNQPQQQDNSSAQQPETRISLEDLKLTAASDWLMPGDTTYIKADYMPSETTETDLVWTISDNLDDGVTVNAKGKVQISDSISFDTNETEKLVVVTATSKENPSLSRSVVLTIYDPDKISVPKLSTPTLNLAEELTPDWARNGKYGQLSWLSDGIPQFNTDITNGSTTIYNNGCAWYLDERKGRTDVSDYKYIVIKMNTNKRNAWNTKLMTWSGSDDAEFYWDKKDSWGGNRADILYDMSAGDTENQDITLVYRTESVFNNSRTAKMIGLGIKAAKSGDEDTKENYETKEAIIKTIEFTNVLPQGCSLSETEDTTSVDLSETKLSLTDSTAVSWTQQENFAITTYNADGSVNINTEPAGHVWNNGSAWYINGIDTPVNVSAYNYVYIKVKTDAEVGLMTWSANSSPNEYYGKKVLYDPQTAVTSDDGTKLLVYRTSTAFTNTEKARGIGILLKSGTEEQFCAQTADIYEIGFSNTLPEEKSKSDDNQTDASTPKPATTLAPTSTPVTTVTPAATPMATAAPTAAPTSTPVTTVAPTEAPDYYFTDLVTEDIAGLETSSAEVNPVRDSDGMACTEICFTKTNQRAYFKLPNGFDPSDYTSVQITANVPAQLILNLFNDQLDLNTEDWWSVYNCASAYPFYGGSVADRSNTTAWYTGYTGAHVREEQTLDMSEMILQEGEASYLAIGANSAPACSFGKSNYLIYSIVFVPNDEDIPEICLMSTENTEASPSEPTEFPTENVLIPDEDYSIVLSADREADATKDKTYYRTNVVYNDDGSVSYTCTDSDYNTGMVFCTAAGGAKINISDYDNIDVDLDGPSSVSLKCFYDASSWWNKVEFWEDTNQTGRRIERFYIDGMAEAGFDFSYLDGIGIGFNEEGSGKDITIYSITARKK